MNKIARLIKNTRVRAIDMAIVDKVKTTESLQHRLLLYFEYPLQTLELVLAIYLLSFIDQSFNLEKY